MKSGEGSKKLTAILSTNNKVATTDNDWSIDVPDAFLVSECPDGTYEHEDWKSCKKKDARSVCIERKNS
jgi:hypothetical protein